MRAIQTGIRMTYLGALSGGLAMIAVGLLKAYLHTMSTGVIHITTCLGRDVTLYAQGSLWSNAHCWGCYMALAGVLVIVATVSRRLRPAKRTF